MTNWIQPLTWAWYTILSGKMQTYPCTWSQNRYHCFYSMTISICSAKKSNCNCRALTQLKKKLRLRDNPDIIECVELNVETCLQIPIFATLGVRVSENDDLPVGPFPRMRTFRFNWNPVVFAIAKTGYKAINRRAWFVRDTSLRHLVSPQIDIP